MKKLTLCENVLEPESWQTFDVENVTDFLMTHFEGKWPATARIYHNFVAESANVTPFNEAGVERMEKLEGHFFCLVMPADPITIIAIIAVAIAAVSIGLSFLLRPSANVKNQQAPSPNNQLGSRQNTERPNQRIPDIVGEVWATPDLIAVPYRVFIGNREFEYCNMCVGKGAYDILEVRDDTTPVSEIDGESVEIYAPFTSANSGDAPQLRIGGAIGEPVRQVKRSNAINGQILRAPNAKQFTANKNVAFQYPDSIIASGGGDLDFTKYFAEGERITLGNATARDPGGVHASVDLAGTYFAVSVTTTEIVLQTPSDTNAHWNDLNAFSGSVSTYGSPTIVGSGDGWIGPFVFTEPDMDEVWNNIVCSQGSYEVDSKGNQHAINIDVEIEVQGVDASNYGIGEKFYYSGTIIGSSTTKEQRAVTIKSSLPFAGPCQVRARRLTSTDLRAGYSVSDQCQWRDSYSITPVAATDFGNVTTLQCVTWPTQDALAIKERKINCLVIRKLPTLGIGTGASEITVDGKCMPWNWASGFYVGSGWSALFGGASGSYPHTFVATPTIAPAVGTLVRMRLELYGDGRDLTNVGGFAIEDALNNPIISFSGVLPGVYKQALWTIGADHIRFTGVGPSGFSGDKAASYVVSGAFNDTLEYGENDGIDPVLVDVVAGQTIRISTKSNTVRNLGDEVKIIPSVLLNGWGVNAHKGDYEGGVSQAHQVNCGLNADTTYPYTNPGDAIDDSDDTYAEAVYQHGHRYFGCVYGFSSPLTSVDGMRIKILSEITAAIITLRDAEARYSMDGGATWPDSQIIYRSNAHVLGWDFVNLPNGTNPNQVQVMVFMDAHDDMGQRIRKLLMSSATVVVTSAYPDIYMDGMISKLALCGAFADNAGNVIEPIAIGDSATFLVPVGATKLQLGVNDNLFDNNTGEIVAIIQVFDPTVAPSYDPTNVAATKNAADILIYMALDPYIGNRTIDELDIVGMYQAMAAVQAYFGTHLCTEFCYTFDDYKVSFEESAADIAAAVFCTAFRRGSIISLSFEKQTSNSIALFNHRNKTPKSEVRTFRFGPANTNDGIELDYIDPNAPNVPPNDTQVTLYYPEDKSAVNPKKITTIGIRNNVQAKLFGWRLFRKIKYQNVSVEFEALSEAAYLVLNDRILVADNTRPDTDDGQVDEQVVLEIKLSQPFTFVAGHTYTIFLYHSDATVEAIAISAGSADDKVVLAAPPSVPLIVEDNKAVHTAYTIVDDADGRELAFLVAEKSAKDGGLYDVKCVNYDDRYYTHDTDFKTGALVENVPAASTSDGYTGGGGSSTPTIGTDTTDPNAIHYKVSVDGVTLG